MIGVLILPSDALRLAVDEELHLVGIVVVAPQVDIVAGHPVPVRKQVQHGLLRPLALVHIVAILGETCQVDDAEVAAAGRETIGRGFAYVVEACPDKLSTNIRRVLHHVPRLFVSARPRGVHIVIG